MIVPVIIDEINAADSFDEFLNTMSIRYAMRIRETTVEGTKVSMLTRPTKPNNSCVLHDECSLVVVTEDHELIVKAIERIYEYGHKYCPLKITEGKSTGADPPIYVEEKLPGIMVTLSKYNLTYLISTKEHVHGYSSMPGKSEQNVSEFFVSTMNELQPNKGLDALFANAWFSPFTWTFQIVPLKYDKFDLVLLGATNMDSGEELSRNQVDNLAMYFKLKRPEKVIIYKEAQIQDAIDTLLRINSSIDGVILATDQQQRAQIPIQENSRIGLYQNGSRKEILSLAGCVMRNMDLSYFKESKLVDIFETNMYRLQNEGKILYSLNKHRRTRKKFALAVDHHPMAKVLYAIRDSKIESVTELFKALSSIEFIKMVGMVDGERLHKVITEYKEKSCQHQR